MMKMWRLLGVIMVLGITFFMLVITAEKVKSGELLYQEKGEKEKVIEEKNLLMSEQKNEQEKSKEEKKERRYTIHHKGFGVLSVKQEYVSYAYEISGGDILFVGLLEAENNERDPHRQSEIDGIGPNGKEDSRGFCQVHKPSHPEVIRNELFWTDWRWQMRVCYELYIKGVYFGGKKKAKEKINLFLRKEID